MSQLSSSAAAFVPLQCVPTQATSGMSASADPPVDTGSAATKCTDVDQETSTGQSTCEGDLPSVGSAGHADGSCKRCAFFPKGRCKNGTDCTHCHFPHVARSRLRKRGAAKHKEAAELIEAMSDSEVEESCE